MEKRFIQLLQNQIDKLSDDEFDLEAWKTGASAVIARVFDVDDIRIKQIESLKIDL